VHLRFAPVVATAEKQAIHDELVKLSDRIDGIVDFQYRRNVSVEAPLVRGFNDMFWFDFRDVAVRDAYLDGAFHMAIGGRIIEKVDCGAESVFVCDIEV